jgi:hypothetical protein
MPRAVRGLGRAGLAAALVLAAPRAGMACAVCLGSQSDLARKAFFGTTMLLTLLPFVLIGGLIWWVRRRARELDLQARRDARAAEAPDVSRASSSQ